MVRVVTKNLKRAPVFFCGDRRTFKKDNPLCSIPVTGTGSLVRIEGKMNGAKFGKRHCRLRRKKRN